MQLQDKIIIITGGNGLLGTAIIEDIRTKGAIIINADINVDDNLAANTVCCDITNDNSIKDLFAKVLSRYGRLDGLVNNAYPRTNDWGNIFEEVTMKSWRENIDMQLNSCFLMCQHAAVIMKKQSAGSIVNIGSIYGVNGNDFTVYENTDMTSPVAYSAIKGGIINLTRYLAAYLGKNNIRVNCVSPGGIFNNQPDHFVKQFSKKVPLKRMASPQDVAPAIAFLLSDEAKYITGHNLMVDGGWTAI